MEKIGRAGPTNAAILDTERALIEKDDSRIFVIDEALAEQIKFIREGEFVQKGGSKALKLIGNVVPIEKVEVVRHVRENLAKEYPLSAMELAAEIKRRLPAVRQSEIWKAIAENDLKNDSDYSAYNFRNKKQEDHFKQTGYVPTATPSIYNYKAVAFLIKILKD